MIKPSRLKLLDVPGGYFQLVDYSAIRDVDDINFSEWLVREGGVAAIPLSPFYESRTGHAAGPPVLRQERRHHGSRRGAPVQTLTVSLVQGATRWHDAAGNRDYYGKLVRGAAPSDLIVLPETFLSGFTERHVRKRRDDGRSQCRLDVRAWRGEVNATVTGSLVIREGDTVYNRLIWASPDGTLSYYDKRHLFRMAGEHTRYGGGNDRLIVELKGWRILPQVCYDLRFPVWLRNGRREASAGGMDYDLALFVANWPAPRRQPWRTLLRARAIENLCLCDRREPRRRGRQRPAVRGRQRGDRSGRRAAGGAGHAGTGRSR